MRAALICPGPSVFQTFDPDHPGVKLAVNRAALWFAADHWAANDLPLIEQIGRSVLGQPQLWCNHDTADSLRRKENRWGKLASAFSSLHCPVPAWHLYTAPAALVVAAHLGATRIDVFGADWTDAPDADGEMPPSCRRDPSRWEQERAIWFEIVSRLQASDVRVNRVLPQT